MSSLTIGVTGLNAVDNPGPGIGVARSLKEDKDLDVTIVGLVYDAMEPGAYMDWLVDRAFVVPYPAAGSQSYFARLQHIHACCPLDFILPTLDTELPLFFQFEGDLASRSIGSFMPTKEQYRLRGKDRLSELAAAVDLTLPETEVVSSYEALARAVDRIGTPVMIKGAFYKAYRAATQQEAASAYGRIVAEWGYPVIVQEVVRGEELNVVAVGDGRGGSLGRVAVKKTSTTESGKIWTGVSIANEQMLEASDRFVERYRWRGPFELECIVDGSDIYLIEINPRFPAWSYLATGVGINLPARMVRFAMGLPVPESDTYEAGRLFIRYTYELVTGMEPFQNLVTRGER